MKCSSDHRFNSNLTVLAVSTVVKGLWDIVLVATVIYVWWPR